jgi:hypothetical protein
LPEDDYDSEDTENRDEDSEAERSDNRIESFDEPGALPEGSWDADETPVFARTLSGVRKVLFSPHDTDVVYAATPMGLYRSTDNAEHFDALPLPRRRGGYDVRDVAVDPLVPTHIFVATRAGCLESMDGGYTWNPLPGRPGQAAGLSLLVLAGMKPALLVGSSDGLYRSDDGGQTFLLQLLSQGGREQAIGSLAYSEARNEIYVGTGRGLYVGSLDASIYQPVTQLQGHIVHNIGVSPIAEGVIFVATDEECFRLTLPKETLTPLLEEAHVRGAVYASPDPRNAQVLWIATARGLFRRVKGEAQVAARIMHQRLQELIQREPTIDEVADAAIEYARLSPHIIQSSLDRSQLAAAFPQLRIRVQQRRQNDHGIGWGLSSRSLEELDEYSEILGDIFDEEPEWRRTRNWGYAWCDLNWNVENMVLHRYTMRVVNEQNRTAKQRQRILNRVSRLYTARQRSLAQVASRRARDPQIEMTRLLRLLEYTARLDGMTGGFFTRIARERGAEAIVGVSYDGSSIRDDSDEDIAPRGT